MTFSLNDELVNEMLDKCEVRLGWMIVACKGMPGMDNIVGTLLEEYNIRYPGSSVYVEWAIKYIKKCEKDVFSSEWRTLSIPNVSDKLKREAWIRAIVETRDWYAKDLGLGTNSIQDKIDSVKRLLT